MIFLLFRPFLNIRLYKFGELLNSKYALLKFILHLTLISFVLRFTSFCCSYIFDSMLLNKTLTESTFFSLIWNNLHICSYSLLLQLIYLKRCFNYSFEDNKRMVRHKIEPHHEKICFYLMRTTKAQISLRIRSLISAFIVRCLDSIISLVSISEISSL